MTKKQIIDALKGAEQACKNTYSPISVESARQSLIRELQINNLWIDYPDHKAVRIPGPCVVARALAKCAGLSNVLLIHTGIYETTITFYWPGNPETAN